jgi:hypothetical protein
MKLNLLVVVAFVILLVIATPFTTRAQSAVAYVKDINGEWHLNGSSSLLQKGKALAAGHQISFTVSNVIHSFITIADVNGRTIIYKNCDNRGECNQSFRISNPGASPSLLGRAFRAVMHLWETSPPRYVSFISRGDGTLVEAVVRLESNQVDLAPALVKLRRGQYLLRFKSLSAQANSSSEPISFFWDPRHPKPLPVQGLTKGLYELQRLDLTDKIKMEPGTEAWILVASGTNYQEATRSFEQVKTMTAQWGKDTTDETVRSFLRASLDSLAAAK